MSTPDTIEPSAASYDTFTEEDEAALLGPSDETPPPAPTTAAPADDAAVDEPASSGVATLGTIDDDSPASPASAAPSGTSSASEFLNSQWAGGVLPAGDGSGPTGYAVKGNADSMLFHTEASPYYKRTKAEVWFKDEASAESAGFTRWDRRGQRDATDNLVKIPDGAFGPGSADPAPDGSGPDGYGIKGNADSMLFHTSDSPYYNRTKAEVWFKDEETAVKAGFTSWRDR